MSQLKQREGFTLLELVIALLLLGIVSGAIYQILATSQRTYLAQTQRFDLQENIRAGAAILPAEFRTLDAADGDIDSMSATAIRIRAIRKLGFLCVPPTLGGGLGNNIFTVRVAPAYGDGPFAAEDSVLVYWEGDSTTRSDDSWVPGQVQSVNAINPAACPDGGALAASHPGYVVTLHSPWPVGTEPWSGVAFNTPNKITNGSPVYAFQKVTYALFQSPVDGRWYVGQSAQGGTMQPLIGPLTGPNGLTLTYYDATGAVTAVPTQVAQIEIVLRAETVSPVRPAYAAAPSYQVDSVDTRVALRNNLRCGPCL